MRLALGLGAAFQNFAPFIVRGAWLLTGGLWADSGSWIDTSVWID